MASKKRFVDWAEHTLARTPKHDLKGTLVVDQVYAHYQHANPHFFHPTGGEAFYLTTPLYVNISRYMKELGRGAVHGRLQTVMRDITEDLSDEVYKRAPVEFHDLRQSGHPIVERDGRIVYDRDPVVRRLSEEELRQKNRLSRTLHPHRYVRRGRR